MFAPFGRGYSSTPNPSSGAKYGLVDSILSFLERMNVGCASKYYTSSSPSGGRYSDPLSPQWVGSLQRIVGLKGFLIVKVNRVCLG
jgi:hypothetical protein